MVARRHPERDLQKQVVAFIDAAYPQLVCFHPANGGKRSKAEAGKFKAMGVRPGVSDLCLILPNGLFAAIELKAGRGALTTEQATFRDRIQALGCLFAEARSLEDVADRLERWLLPFGWVAKARVAA